MPRIGEKLITKKKLHCKKCTRLNYGQSKKRHRKKRCSLKNFVQKPTHCNLWHCRHRHRHRLNCIHVSHFVRDTERTPCTQREKMWEGCIVVIDLRSMSIKTTTRTLRTQISSLTRWKQKEEANNERSYYWNFIIFN